jgi:hypothetical protein
MALPPVPRLPPGGCPAPPAPDRGFQPGAPSASNGIVPTSSQRTRSPRNTGPSTQERTIRVIPSVPGDRQHAPHAHARPAGHGLVHRAWTGIAYRRGQRVTSRSTGTGADA